ncbi:MAG: 2-amino-4-hydroxy-6-hydroxymethyldihydropteridine diphosphokinase [Muribaculaceae bacterium]|nr:2-amino-4-hydroxy-6-hydroxymethyldihydropteridine diphosphokinase [Muribaculaceae bacterium]
MNNLILSIGANSPDREWQMAQAVKRMKQLFKKTVVSEIYEVPAHNGVDAPYLNAVMVASTTMNMEDVTVALKQWETLCGRTPASKQQGVIPIDLDIVVWNDEVVRPVDYSRNYVSTGIARLLSAMVK